MWMLGELIGFYSVLNVTTQYKTEIKQYICCVIDMYLK